MDKFHINSKGNVMPCNAKKRACRYGEEQHFEIYEEALRFAENSIKPENKKMSPLNKKSTTDQDQTKNTTYKNNEQYPASYTGLKISYDGRKFDLYKTNQYIVKNGMFSGNVEYSCGKCGKHIKESFKNLIATKNKDNVSIATSLCHYCFLANCFESSPNKFLTMNF